MAPIKIEVVEDDGFEPPNSKRADLQSAVFSHFTNPPRLKIWWLGTESNRRHKDFQSFALPTELPSQTIEEKNGGADEIRTRGLLRDRQAC